MSRMSALSVLGGSRDSARTFGWRVMLLFMVLEIFRLSVAVGQEPVAFYYGPSSQGYNYDGVFDYLFPDYYFVDVQSLAAANPDVRLTVLQHGENITCHGDFTANYMIDGSLFLGSINNSETSRNVSGRCLYKNPVNLMDQCAQSFGTMFRFRTSNSAYGSISGLEGLAFIIASDTSMQGEGGGYLGWLNSTTNGQAVPGHNFAVEIDFVQDVQFHDPPHPHIGVDLNSLSSVTTGDIQLSYDAEEINTVWIDYYTSTKTLDVYIGDIDWKPPSPTVSTHVDLTEILSGGMFVGFSASTVVSQDSYAELEVIGWTFNSNGPAPDLPRNGDGTLFDPGVEARKRKMRTIVLAVAITIPSVLVFLVLVFTICTLYRRNARLTALAKIHNIQPSMLHQGPKTFKYKALSTATKGFSCLLGTGGFGSVYMGKLVVKGAAKPVEVAVKRISDTSKQGASEFLAEVKIIGQAQHRNLVRLLGWCHERGELLLVYDYMPNGSVDHHLYKSTPGETVLTWSRRLKIVSGVATALAFLHEEWEQRVIHRDVKSSNIMLDGDFNARLGDFGLARSTEHDKELLCTAVAGTRGYMAPELGMTFKPTEKSDVYSFGAVVLEVATGKKPMLSQEDREALKEVFLVDWVWGLYRDDALLDAADGTLHNAYDPGEMIMFLKIGLLCCHPNPDDRPTMRDVINIWKGSNPFPPLPRSRPVPVFPLNPDGLALNRKWDDTTVLASSPYGEEDQSGTGTFASDSYHRAVKIPSNDDADSSRASQETDGRSGGSATTTLRYRQRTTTSLPF
ncbi:unnamed protein product [Calypogeia fissa]